MNENESKNKIARVIPEQLKRSFLQRITDRLFGYDFFISYAWNDGREYATAVAKQLTVEGFNCFLDSESYLAGDDWKKIGAWALRKTSYLVFIATPEALESQAVLRELDLFTRSGRRIIPVNLDGCLDSLRRKRSSSAPCVRSVRTRRAFRPTA